jgi:hypothetical protein
MNPVIAADTARGRYLRRSSQLAEEAKEAVMRIGNDTLYRQLFGDELPTLD